MNYILMVGQFRGNHKSWNSIYSLSKKLNATIIIGGYLKWEVQFPHVFIPIIDEKIKGSSLEKSNHIHSKRYLHQWNALYKTYMYYKDNIKDSDIIIKLRNDLFFNADEFDITNLIKNDTLYVPEKEFHYPIPFDISSVCNDQIVYGNKYSMNVYFRFPYDLRWDNSYDEKGIEFLLRQYIYQQNLHISVFNLSYAKV